MKTLLLKNGRIIDGTGKKTFYGHILIEDDRSRAVIGEDTLPEAERVIDVGEKVITPGFIDMHSHTDWVLPGKDHEQAVKCLPEQGITTIIGGNCFRNTRKWSFAGRPTQGHCACVHQRPACG